MPAEPLFLDPDRRPDAGRSPVVLLHGWGMSPHVYERCTALLRARHYRVLTPPVGAAEGLWSIPGVVAALVRRLESEECHRAVVIGHSLGGGVAVALAATRPDLVAHLVLVDAVGIPMHGRSPASWLSGSAGYVTSVSATALLRLVVGTALHPARVLNWISAGAWALHADLEPVLATVGRTVSTTVVWGAHDRLIPPEVGQEMARLLGAPFHAVPGDHAWPLKEPARLAAIAASVARHGVVTTRP